MFSLCSLRIAFSLSQFQQTHFSSRSRHISADVRPRPMASFGTLVFSISNALPGLWPGITKRRHILVFYYSLSPVSITFSKKFFAKNFISSYKIVKIYLLCKIFKSIINISADSYLNFLKEKDYM